MIRFLIYLVPVFVCFIQGGMFFYSADSFARAGMGGFLVGCTMSAWAFVYAVVSVLMARRVTDRNAASYIMTGAAFLGISSAGFLCTKNFLMLQFLWIFLIGIGGALYCTAFQVFMKNLEPDRDAGIVRPTSLYTFSWSIGMASGPFLFGTAGPYVSFGCSIAMSLLIILGVWLISKMPPAPKPEAGMAGDSVDYVKGPDCVMIGWIAGGLTTLAVALIRALEPNRAAALAFDQADSGCALALLSLVQGVTALSLCRGKLWMYRPFRAFLIGLCGVTGLLLFAFGSTPVSFYLAAAFFGFYSGCLYFYFVFYALAHRDSAKYVAVNEAIVGIVSVIAPPVGGLFAGSDGTSPLPFLIPAILVLGASLFHFAALRRVLAEYFRQCGLRGEKKGIFS